MLKIRVIAVLTFNGLALVKTKNFSNPRMLGNPVQVTKVFNARDIDELVFIDINASKQNRKLNIPLVQKIIKECYMPVTIGGGIRTIDDIKALLKCGADKVVLKSEALSNPDFVLEASSYFGSQCISVAVDVIQEDGFYKVYHDGEQKISLSDFVKEMEQKGAGELLVNSVDNDGKMDGFDSDLYNEVDSVCQLPIVAMGGGGKPSHYQALFKDCSIEAVGSSSIFAYTQYTPNDIKRALKEIDKPVRYFESK